MLENIKNYLRYTKLHFIILQFTNRKYVNWINKEINFHKKFLNKEDQLIFDLGAHVGDKSHIFLNFSKNLVLYEPEEKFIRKLKLRFRNYIGVNIRNYVVYDEIKKIDFYSAENMESHSSTIEGYLKNFSDIKNNKIILKKKTTTTLNNEIDLFGIPFYCKIDCEGSEYQILKNLKYKIKIISFEANIPIFYKNTIKIIESLEKKFFSKFNLRKNNDYEFYFDVNVDTKKIKEVLSKKIDVYEVFVFTE